uniref:Uncharacterized protein n=1 Tax=Chromera velia CCMP2878 TaxID=1169474 RepID=A0A0G4G254_9ALVE|eukprot:Cvel_19898.t1-p1 / transcript=Cvel_19898.t1 / gene=Cvel_19898 / organism=Chromera_velia_CCMP2878 / gene_product=hypothetical protein / transcript_product=hypothetical protein / location=Cvel_scaffold1747:9636-20310(-) / protein_length=2595 / sequence_SO=supercontig / SO=protein_coding / is_pseudo=false
MRRGRSPPRHQSDLDFPTFAELHQRNSEALQNFSRTQKEREREHREREKELREKTHPPFPSPDREAISALRRLIYPSRSGNREEQPTKTREEKDGELQNHLFAMQSKSSAQRGTFFGTYRRQSAEDRRMQRATEQNCIACNLTARPSCPSEHAISETESQATRKTNRTKKKKTPSPPRGKQEGEGALFSGLEIAALSRFNTQDVSSMTVKEATEMVRMQQQLLHLLDSQNRALRDRLCVGDGERQPEPPLGMGVDLFHSPEGPTSARVDPHKLGAGIQENLIGRAQPQESFAPRQTTQGEEFERGLTGEEEAKLQGRPISEVEAKISLALNQNSIPFPPVTATAMGGGNEGLPLPLQALPAPLPALTSLSNTPSRYPTRQESLPNSSEMIPHPCGPSYPYNDQCVLMTSPPNPRGIPPSAYTPISTPPLRLSPPPNFTFGVAQSKNARALQSPTRPHANETRSKGHANTRTVTAPFQPPSRSLPPERKGNFQIPDTQFYHKDPAIDQYCTFANYPHTRETQLNAASFPLPPTTMSHFEQRRLNRPPPSTALENANSQPLMPPMPNKQTQGPTAQGAQGTPNPLYAVTTTTTRVDARVRLNPARSTEMSREEKDALQGREQPQPPSHSPQGEERKQTSQDTNHNCALHRHRMCDRHKRAEGARRTQSQPVGEDGRQQERDQAERRGGRHHPGGATNETCRQSQSPEASASKKAPPSPQQQRASTSCPPPCIHSQNPFAVYPFCAMPWPYQQHFGTAMASPPLSQSPNGGALSPCALNLLQLHAASAAAAARALLNPNQQPGSACFQCPLSSVDPAGLCDSCPLRALKTEDVQKKENECPSKNSQRCRKSPPTCPRKQTSRGAGDAQADLERERERAGVRPEQVEREVEGGRGSVSMKPSRVVVIRQGRTEELWVDRKGRGEVLRLDSGPLDELSQGLSTSEFVRTPPSQAAPRIPQRPSRGRAERGRKGRRRLGSADVVLMTLNGSGRGGERERETKKEDPGDKRGQGQERGERGSLEGDIRSGGEGENVCIFYPEQGQEGKPQDGVAVQHGLSSSQGPSVFVEVPVEGGGEGQEQQPVFVEVPPARSLVQPGYITSSAGDGGTRPSVAGPQNEEGQQQVTGTRRMSAGSQPSTAHGSSPDTLHDQVVFGQSAVDNEGKPPIRRVPTGWAPLQAPSDHVFFESGVSGKPEKGPIRRVPTGWVQAPSDHVMFESGVSGIPEKGPIRRVPTGWVQAPSDHVLFESGVSGKPEKGPIRRVPTGWVAAPPSTEFSEHVSFDPNVGPSRGLVQRVPTGWVLASAPSDLSGVQGDQAAGGGKAFEGSNSLAPPSEDAAAPSHSGGGSSQRLHTGWISRLTSAQFATMQATGNDPSTGEVEGGGQGVGFGQSAVDNEGKPPIRRVPTGWAPLQAPSDHVFFESGVSGKSEKGPIRRVPTGWVQAPSDHVMFESGLSGKPEKGPIRRVPTGWVAAPPSTEFSEHVSFDPNVSPSRGLVRRVPTGWVRLEPEEKDAGGASPSGSMHVLFESGAVGKVEKGPIQRVPTGFVFSAPEPSEEDESQWDAGASRRVVGVASGGEQVLFESGATRKTEKGFLKRVPTGWIPSPLPSDCDIGQVVAFEGPALIKPPKGFLQRTPTPWPHSMPTMSNCDGVSEAGGASSKLHLSQEDQPGQGESNEEKEKEKEMGVGFGQSAVDNEGNPPIRRVPTGWVQAPSDHVLFESGVSGKPEKGPIRRVPTGWVAAPPSTEFSEHVSFDPNVGPSRGLVQRVPTGWVLSSDGSRHVLFESEAMRKPYTGPVPRVPTGYVGLAPRIMFESGVSEKPEKGFIQRVPTPWPGALPSEYSQALLSEYSQALSASAVPSSGPSQIFQRTGQSGELEFAQLQPDGSLQILETLPADSPALHQEEEKEKGNEPVEGECEGKENEKTSSGRFRKILKTTPTGTEMTLAQAMSIEQDRDQISAELQDIIERISRDEDKDGRNSLNVSERDSQYLQLSTVMEGQEKEAEAEGETEGDGAGEREKKRESKEANEESAGRAAEREGRTEEGAQKTAGGHEGARERGPVAGIRDGDLETVVRRGPAERIEVPSRSCSQDSGVGSPAPDRGRGAHTQAAALPPSDAARASTGGGLVLPRGTAPPSSAAPSGSSSTDGMGGPMDTVRETGKQASAGSGPAAEGGSAGQEAAGVKKTNARVSVSSTDSESTPAGGGQSGTSKKSNLCSSKPPNSAQSLRQRFANDKAGRRSVNFGSDTKTTEGKGPMNAFPPEWKELRKQGSSTSIRSFLLGQTAPAGLGGLCGSSSPSAAGGGQGGPQGRAQRAKSGPAPLSSPSVPMMAVSTGSTQARHVGMSMGSLKPEKGPIARIPTGWLPEISDDISVTGSEFLVQRSRGGHMGGVGGARGQHAVQGGRGDALVLQPSALPLVLHPHEAAEADDAQSAASGLTQPQPQALQVAQTSDGRRVLLQAPLQGDGRRIQRVPTGWVEIAGGSSSVISASEAERSMPSEGRGVAGGVTFEPAAVQHTGGRLSRVPTGYIWMSPEGTRSGSESEVSFALAQSGGRGHLVTFEGAARRKPPGQPIQRVPTGYVHIPVAMMNSDMSEGGSSYSQMQ